MLKEILKIGIVIKNKLDNFYPFGSDVSLFAFFRILWKSIVTFDLDQRATSVAFSFLLAVFPGILFLFTLIPYIPIEHLDVQIMAFIKSVAPPGIYDVIWQTIYEIISKPRRDILSFGFLFSLYAATNGINSLTRAFNAALEEKKARSFVRAKGMAAFVLTLHTLLLVLGVILLLSGKIAISYINTHGIINSTLTIIGVKALGYFTIFIIFYLGIASLYYFAPAVHKRMKFFNFGAAFASIVSILTTNLFSYYLENFSRYNTLYGSIGTLIAVMVWVYLISLILILGFEMNLGIREEKEKVKKENNQTI